MSGPVACIDVEIDWPEQSARLAESAFTHFGSVIISEEQFLLLSVFGPDDDPDVDRLYDLVMAWLDEQQVPENFRSVRPQLWSGDDWAEVEVGP